eukprot:1189174-Prorocentrum_minimum.AAC.1
MQYCGCASVPSHDGVKNFVNRLTTTIAPAIAGLTVRLQLVNQLLLRHRALELVGFLIRRLRSDLGSGCGAPRASAPAKPGPSGRPSGPAGAALIGRATPTPSQSRTPGPTKRGAFSTSDGQRKTP